MRGVKLIVAAIALYVVSTPSHAQQTPVCVVINGACASAANPIPTRGGGTSGAVTAWGYQL